MNQASESSRLSTIRRELETYVAGFQRVEEAIRAGSITTPQDGNAAIGSVKDAARGLAEGMDEIAESHQKVDAGADGGRRGRGRGRRGTRCSSSSSPRSRSA